MARHLRLRDSYICYCDAFDVLRLEWIGGRENTAKPESLPVVESGGATMLLVECVV